MSKDFALFEQVLAHTRAYFILEYHAGKREMIYRYVVSKIGDVPPLMVSAALRVLKERAAIIHEKRVWWFISDR